VIVAVYEGRLLKHRIGPIIGGFLGEAAGFRWVFALLALISALLTILGASTLPETYPPVLLRERAVRLQAATGKVYRSTYEQDKKVIIGELLRTSLSRPWKVIHTQSPEKDDADCLLF
jgi:MFS family permease